MLGLFVDVVEIYHVFLYFVLFVFVVFTILMLFFDQWFVCLDKTRHVHFSPWQHRSRPIGLSLILILVFLCIFSWLFLFGCQDQCI